MRNITGLQSHSQLRSKATAPIAGGITLVGIVTLAVTLASSSAVSIRISAGMLGGPARIIADNTGGKAVEFVAPSSSSLSSPDSSTTSPNGTSSPAATPAAYWTPPANAEWQWELDHALSTASASDMGTGKTAYTGAIAPATNPAIYDIDGIDNPASTVSALHSMGKKVVCYIEVGSQGSYYTAAEEGIATSYYDQLKADGLLSATTLAGYAQENYVNINSPAAVTILEAEIEQQCKLKGFDAVETDLDETFGGNEGMTPWTITQVTEENFLETLATYMHSIGLGWIAKNLDDTGNESFVSALEPYAQGMISEESNKNGTTAEWASFDAADKWIGNAEYSVDDGMTLAAFCPADNSHPNVNGVLFTSSGSLAGPRTPCR